MNKTHERANFSPVQIHAANIYTYIHSAPIGYYRMSPL